MNFSIKKIIAHISKKWSYLVNGEPDYLKEYKGNIMFLTSNTYHKRVHVVTTEGSGTVLQDNINSVSVLLYKGQTKSFKKSEVGRWAISKGSTIYFLATVNYPYIYKVKQPVKYRITRSGYAMLTDQCREQYKHIKVINGYRQGTIILNALNSMKIDISNGRNC